MKFPIFIVQFSMGASLLGLPEYNVMLFSLGPINSRSCKERELQRFQNGSTVQFIVSSLKRLCLSCIFSVSFIKGNGQDVLEKSSPAFAIIRHLLRQRLDYTRYSLTIFASNSFATTCVSVSLMETPTYNNIHIL